MEHLPKPQGPPNNIMKDYPVFKDNDKEITDTRRVIQQQRQYLLKTEKKHVNSGHSLIAKAKPAKERKLTNKDQDQLEKIMRDARDRTSQCKGGLLVHSVRKLNESFERHNRKLRNMCQRLCELHDKLNSLWCYPEKQ